MEKFSISQAWKRRKRIRVLTVLAGLVLVFVLGQFVISTGKKPVHAAGTGTAADPYVFTGAEGFVYNNTYCRPDDDGYVYFDTGVYTVTSPCLPGGSSAVDLNAKYVVFGDGSTAQTLVLWGPFTPAGVTFKNKVTVTHAPLVYNETTRTSTYDHATDPSPTPRYKERVGREIDFSTTDGGLTGIGLLKVVDIRASDFVRVEDDATIDVSGRGYPGGSMGTDYTHFHGYPNWDDTAPITLNGGHSGRGLTGTGEYIGYICYGWGGGGSGAKSTDSTGQGGQSYSNGSVCDGSYHDSSYAQDLEYGGGGGSAYFDAHSTVASHAPGGAGGGKISISGGKAIIFPGAKLYANGALGSPQNIVGGAGGGGSINISTTAIAISPSVTTSPEVLGGTADPVMGTAHPGMSGALLVASTLTGKSLGNNIKANGANSGNSNWDQSPDASAAGGGGGYISVTGTWEPLCEITPDSDLDYIPAICETHDVVIDGKGTNFPVYADKERVWQKDDTISVGKMTIDGPKAKAYYVPGGTGVPLKSLKVIQGEECSASTDPTVLWYNYWPPETSRDVKADDTTTIKIMPRFFPSCDSTRHFASLTIKSGGNLTHQGVISTDFRSDLNVSRSASLIDDTNSLVRWKKVDISSPTISLLGGGKIDVSGMGYPGGEADGSNAYSGYGPGGGGAVTQFDAYGSGGGYGGNGSGGGQQGGIEVHTGGAAYGDENIATDFGSGGGAAQHTSSFFTNGSAGGGRIFLSDVTSLVLSSDAKISANGIDGYHYSNDCVGGAGSGGSINIKMDSTLDAYVKTLLGSSGWGGGAQNGTVVINQINHKNSNSSGYIEANGGSASVGAGGGGGGRILITKPAGVPSVSIYKQLTAVMRNGVANSTYNPYALQIGDIVKVTLTILNIPNGGITVTDDWLKSPVVNGAKCDPTPIVTGYGAAVPAPSGYVDPLVWVTTTSSTITYYCKVVSN